VTGIFPIRLISPNLAHDLTPETATTRLPVGHQALAGGDHGHTKAAADTGKLPGTAVDAVAWTRDPSQPLDGRLTAIAVAEL